MKQHNYIMILLCCFSLHLMGGQDWELEWEEQRHQHAIAHIRNILNVENIGYVKTLSAGPGRCAMLEVGIYLFGKATWTLKTRFLQESEVLQVLSQNRTLEEDQRSWIQSLLTGRTSGELCNKVRGYHSHVEGTDSKTKDFFSQVVRTSDLCLSKARLSEEKNKKDFDFAFGEEMHSDDEALT